MSPPPTATAAVSVVDAHVHFVPPRFAGVGGSDPFRPLMSYAKERQVEVRIGGRAIDSVVGEFSRPDVLLAELAAADIDGALLSPWVATLPVGLSDEGASKLCRLQNEAMAEVVRSGGGSFAGLGAVPLSSPERAVALLGDAVADGLAGVELLAISDGRGLGDESLEPLWDAAEDLGALVFVHPGSHGLSAELLDEHYLWNSVGNPVETAVSAAQLVMAGVFDRHPELKILLAHGGGVLPAVASRISRAWWQRPEARADTSLDPDESIRRFYFDTVVHDARLLRALVSFAGVDHVLMGSDHPFDMGVEDPVGAVRALGLAEHEEAAVLGGNARRLAFAAAGGTARPLSAPSVAGQGGDSA